MEVSVEGRLIVVCFAHGQVFATDALCTHGHARLVEGYLEGAAIECPMHGGTFDLHTGAPLKPPCTIPLRTYPVRVQAGRVLVAF